MVKNTDVGDAIAIVDVDGLHQVIGRHIPSKGYMTGGEFRFLRKKLDLMAM